MIFIFRWRWQWWKRLKWWRWRRRHWQQWRRCWRWPWRNEEIWYDLNMYLNVKKFYFNLNLSIILLPVLITKFRISLDLFYLPGFTTDHKEKLITWDSAKSVVSDEANYLLYLTVKSQFQLQINDNYFRSNRNPRHNISSFD